MIDIPRGLGRMSLLAFSALLAFALFVAGEWIWEWLRNKFKS